MNVGDRYSRPDQIADRISFLAVAAVFGFLLWLSLFQDVRQLIVFLPDDAFFYYKIAGNVVAGQGLSFDGISWTNGVQPLWQLVTIGLAVVLPNDPEVHIRAILVVQLAIMFGAYWLVNWVNRHVFSAMARLPVTFLFMSLLVVPGVDAMESPLLLLALALLYAYAWKSSVFSNPHPVPQLCFGVIVGLMMLARLDWVFLGAAICLACLVGICTHGVQARDAVQRAVLVGVGATIVVLPYLIFNQLTFGGIMPMSGSLKSAFPHADWRLHVLSKFGLQIKVCVLVAAIFLGAAVVGRRTKVCGGSGFVNVSSLILCAAVMVHFAHEALFVRWGVYHWHFYPYVLAAILVAQLGVAAVLERAKGILKACVWPVAVLMLVVCGWRVITIRLPVAGDTYWHRISYDAAVWVREHTGKEDVIAMKDPGVMAYFSGRKVISMDGLVNNAQFQEVLRDRKLADYLSRNNVRYLVQHAFYSLSDVRPQGASWAGYRSAAMTYLSHKYLTWSDPIPLLRENEVYRSEPYIDEGRLTVLIIWKL